MVGDPHEGQPQSTVHDALKTAWLFESDNEWGIPMVPPVPLSAIPKSLVSYRTRIESATEKGRIGVHFFLDDYRFESVWNTPAKALRALAGWKVALSPDFSLYRNYPQTLQQYNVYRNRWCQAYWTYHGITVIPTVSWSTPASYSFAFAGLPRKSVVALGTVGLRWDNLVERHYFLRGWEAMLNRLDPVKVLVYGELPRALADTVAVKCYPTHWEGVKQMRRADGR